MTGSPKTGRDQLVENVRVALELSTKKDAEHVLGKVISAIETTLFDNLGTNGFTLKLNSLAKLIVHHRVPILRKIPFTGEVKLTQFKRKIRLVILGRLRSSEYDSVSQLPLT